MDLNNLLIVDTAGNETTNPIRPTRVDVIFFDIDQDAASHTRSVILEADGETKATTPRDREYTFDVINQHFDDAHLIVAHGVRFDRKMVTAIPELAHWLDGDRYDYGRSKPWICTMEDFEWPGLESVKQAKVDTILKRKRRKLSTSTEAKIPYEEVKGWLKLKEVCEHENYQIQFKAKEGERQLNNAELLLSCLVKVPDLRDQLIETPLYR